MAASETEIANSALSKLGTKRILSLNEDTREARLLKEQFAKIRDDLLRSHPWNFAIARANLAAITTAPAFGFEKAFQLPTDCLRVLETDDDTTEWQREEDKILSNSSTMAIKYVKRITDVGQWDANFCEVMALSLAEDISYAITQNAALKDRLAATLDRKLRTARSFDGQEGGTRPFYARQWLNSRY